MTTQYLRNKSATIALAAAVLTLSLAACGGGGEDEDEDDGPDDASGAGIWDGTYRVDGQTASSGMFGLVTEEGDFVLVTVGSRIFFGSGTSNGNSFSANAVSYQLGGSGRLPTSFQGTIAESSTITGSYSFTGQSATFSLAYRGIYTRPASLATLAGVYSYPANPQNIVITASMTSNGAFTINYSAPTGCTLNGTVQVPQPTRNYYRWTGTFTSCGTSDGASSGLMFLDDLPPGQNNLLRIFAQNQAQTAGGWMGLVK